MLDKVAVGLGAKKLVTAVGSAASAAYGTISGLGKAASGIASATQGASDAAKQKTDEAPTNVIYVNFGMAGSAGKQKVIGGTSISKKPNVVKPQISEKMPTEALLDTAVKYLNSIDRSLKSQLEFEKKSYEQQVRDEREAIVENKSSFNFSDIRDKFSNLKSNASEGASLAGTLAKYALGLGALAAVVASSVDQKELDALKENVEEFKKSFGWLSEIGAAVGAGGLLGFLFGGRGVVGRLKGGLVGMVAAHVVDRMFPSLFGGGNGEVDPVTGEPIQQSKSMSALGIGLSVGAGVLAARYGMKKLPGVKRAGTNVRGLGRAAKAGSVAQMQAATRKGTSWLSSRRGRKFLVFLGRRLGKGVVAKLGRTLARIVAFLLLSATGVGAIPGIIGILGSIAFIGWDIFDIASAIWDAWNESKEEPEAAAPAVAVPASTETTATPVAGTPLSNDRVVSKSATGSPEKAQAFFESKGWTREQAAGIVGNIAVESGFDPNANGDGGNAWGLAQWNRQYSPDRVANFEKVMRTPLRGSTFEQQLEFINWELNNTEKAAGNALRGATTAAAAAEIVDSKYERSDGTALSRRISNANAAMAGDYSKVSTGGASGYDSSSGGFETTAGKMAGAGLKEVGKILGALGSAVIKPGIARTDTAMSAPQAGLIPGAGAKTQSVAAPVSNASSNVSSGLAGGSAAKSDPAASLQPAGSGVSKQIDSKSMKLQTDLTLGVKKEKAKTQAKSPSAPSANPGVPGPIKSVSSMDPNYNNVNILSQYLGHFKKAA